MEKQKYLTYIVEGEEFQTENNHNQEEIQIENVLKLLTDAQKNGATHISFNGRAFDDEVKEVYISAYFQYEESDEDFQERVNKKHLEDLQRESDAFYKEQQEYLRLKRKYENNPVFNPNK